MYTIIYSFYTEHTTLSPTQYKGAATAPYFNSLAILYKSRIHNNKESDVFLFAFPIYAGVDDCQPPFTRITVVYLYE